MRIDSVNIINLARRTDLAIAQRAVWTAMGATPEQIVFHEARDGVGYSDRNTLIKEARDVDGWHWFTDAPDGHWMGVGELACYWSISRLLRYIADQEDDEAIYLYVLADRFSKKPLPYLNKLFNRLPNFMLFQFKGIVPYWDDLEREAIKAAFPRECVPADDVIPEGQIEYGCTKHGDGVLAITSEGARYMLGLHSKYGFPLPYEIMLWHEGDDRVCPEGVYSTPCAEYDFSDESSQWEGEFPHPLAGWNASDIGEANARSETGDYRNHNEALDQEWFESGELEISEESV